MMSDEDEEHGIHSDTGNPPPTRQNNGTILQNLNLPFGINSVVSPEGRLLLGRAVAAALFYISLAKVVLVQYGNLRSGLISVKTSVDSVDALRRKVFQAVGAFIVNFGYLPRLFKFSAREVDDYEDIRGRKTVVVDPPEGLTDNDTSSSESKHDDGTGDGDSPESRTDNVPEKGGDKDEADNNDDGEEDKSRFKPFFFLDNIIT
jgi:hypothetical protein